MDNENDLVIRMRQAIKDPKFKSLFDDLLRKKEEYEKKVKDYKESNDIEKVNHYLGACEGITVAISSIWHYLYPSEK